MRLIQRPSTLACVVPFLSSLWLGCSGQDDASPGTGGTSSLQATTGGASNARSDAGGTSNARSDSGGSSARTDSGSNGGAPSSTASSNGTSGGSSNANGGTANTTGPSGGTANTTGPRGGTANTTGPSGGTKSSGGSGTKQSGVGGTGAGGTVATGGVQTGVGGAQNSTATAKGGSGGTSSSSSGTSTVPVSCNAATPDECPMSSGLTFECKQRFALGVNYAWQTFGADFGGIPAWNQNGVSGNSATVGAALADMKANGVSVIRWWMFPDFRGSGVEFDANGDATGLSAVAKQDIAAALKLAQDNNLYIVFTIFSFDDFRPTRTDAGLNILGMTPMVTDAARRAKLIEGVVRGSAQAVAASPNSHRLLGWDVINEPEWAVKATGNAVGGQDFEPNPELTPVSLADMKALINESLTVLGKETPWAQRSVGWAAAKWSWAFADITNLEFNQPHIYEWVNKYWPYTKTPTELGYTNGKPTVMGEFFLQTNPFNTTDTYAQILQSWWTNGYAGAWGWQYIENKSSLPLTKAFATEKKCQAAF